MNNIRLISFLYALLQMLAMLVLLVAGKKHGRRDRCNSWMPMPLWGAAVWVFLAAVSSVAEQISYIFLNYTFVPLFMIIPVMVASIIAANSVVGEKERKTLETLLYTPVTNREFLTA